MTRAAVVVAFVGAWMALGFALRLDPNLYLLAGVPLTLLFQVLVARKPIRALWVREAPPARWNAAAIATTIVLGGVAIWMASADVRARHPTLVAYSLVQLAGAFAAGYAVAQLDRARLRRGLVPMLIAIALPLALQLARYFFAHGHFVWRTFFVSLLQYQAVTFLVEEVTFRGALDSYVAAAWPHWTSALVPALLWGPWHLPIVPIPNATPILYAGAAIVLVVVHLPVGLALAIAWRRSGNLWLPACAHSFIDAVRNAIKT